MRWGGGVGGDVACEIAQKWGRWRRRKRHGDRRGFSAERERELRNDAWEEMRVYKCRGGEESRERSREGGGGVRTW
jgi:hypothetical protein